MTTARERPPTVTTGPLLVVQTWFLPNTPSGWCYVVELARDARPRTPRLQLTTRHDALYQAALDAEGSPEPYIAHYHRDGVRLELDALVPASIAGAVR